MGAINGRRNSYGQYCPISRALDVLGERWSLLIIRDMLVGATRFNDLARGLPGLSRSLLSKRLQQFEEEGLVDKVGSEYHLTQAGRDLEPVVFGIGEWGAKWSFEDPMAAELDSELLVWWIHTRLNTNDLPGRRQVFHFRFSDDPKLFWIVVENGVPSVCIDDPGYEVHMTLSTDVATLYKVWEARIGLRDAIRSGDLEVIGQRAYTSRLGEILQFSPVAPIVGAVGQ
jgi:DNA-binding HxlR family transcriptional regulator